MILLLIGTLSLMALTFNFSFGGRAYYVDGLRDSILTIIGFWLCCWPASALRAGLRRQAR